MPVPSVLWRCWLGDRKGIHPVKNWLVGCWHGYLSAARCRLAYTARLMPLPLTVSCFSKFQIGFTFLYRLTQLVLDKGTLNRCVCVSTRWCRCNLVVEQTEDGELLVAAVQMTLKCTKDETEIINYITIKTFTTEHVWRRTYWRPGCCSQF